jgi:hypothetical protein
MTPVRTVVAANIVGAEVGCSDGPVVGLSVGCSVGANVVCDVAIPIHVTHQIYQYNNKNMRLGQFMLQLVVIRNCVFVTFPANFVNVD